MSDSVNRWIAGQFLKNPREPPPLLIGGLVGYLDVGESLLGVPGGISWPGQLQQALHLHGLPNTKYIPHLFLIRIRIFTMMHIHK